MFQCPSILLTLIGLINKMSDSDNDELFEQLEAELEQNGTFDYYREKQILQIQNSIQQRENLNKRFTMFSNEKELLDTISQNKNKRQYNYIVVFINETFTTCQVLVEKLKDLVQSSDGRYSVYVIQATKSPFLVSKLDIKILPTIVAYSSGYNIGTHVGLPGLLADPADVYTLDNFKLRRLIESYFPKKNEDSSDDEV